MRAGTTRLSSRGQVVIPAWMRQRLRLRVGEPLRVELGPPGERAVVLRGHDRREIEPLLERGYRWLETSGIDLVEALHDARRRARLRERQGRRP